MRLLFRALTILPACAVFGCVTTSQLAPPTSPSSWDTEHFTVRFFPRPRSPEDQKSASYYEVVPIRVSGDVRMRIRSEQSTSGFDSVMNPAPSNYIKVLPDSKSEALIIHETVPNDCAPYANYIWIRRDELSAFAHSYLQLPSRSLGAPIEYELPEIVSLHDGMLTYRYSTGRAIRVDVASLPSEQEPTPPG